MGTQKERKVSIVLRLVLLVFAIYIVFSLGNLQIQLVQSKKELAAINATKEEKVLKVNQMLDLLENGEEADFIERAARERLGYAFADEQVFVDLSGN